MTKVIVRNTIVERPTTTDKVIFAGNHLFVEPSSGYSQIINGITAYAKVNGIEKINIAEVNGVA